MKMGDVFDLPIEACDIHAMYAHGGEDHAVHAVNNHDKLVEGLMTIMNDCSDPEAKSMAYIALTELGYEV